ncbi:MAG: 1,4-alpha-glucan branching protein [Bacteroidetes bacterium]|nr:1,4-alpha-glucan branching protein [Bacteroidota bacterium]MBS1973722.1 1,4-alpha-glucan branching protein [Bacteroidota bacterium]
MSRLFPAIAWGYDSNIYEVNTRQYTQEGTFNAFAQHLPRLKDMGVEILWFMPITPISIEKRKGSLGSYYACSDYTAINPEYGTLDDFKNLSKTAQGMGFKIIIDWVANHTGWGHRWTKEHPEYYSKDENGNFTEKHGWDDVIDLNYNNAALRQAMKSAMKFWVDECGIDGFRCDMAHLVPLDFWVEARAFLEPVKKMFWLAECEEVSYHDVFDATYTWKWMHKTEDFARRQTGVQGLWQLLQEYNDEFPFFAFRAYFTSNHDENTWNGTEYEKYGPAAKNLAVFSCLWNGTPLVYSGQEMPNCKRLKFFDKDSIEWTGKFELHNFYKALLSLRKRNKALRAGDDSAKTFKLSTNADDKIFSFLRKNDRHEVLVILNFSGENIPAEINDAEVNGSFINTFSGEPKDFSSNKNVELLPWAWLVFEK